LFKLEESKGSGRAKAVESKLNFQMIGGGITSFLITARFHFLNPLNAIKPHTSGSSNYDAIIQEGLTFLEFPTA
jgi:hypothetical protein